MRVRPRCARIHVMHAHDNAPFKLYIHEMASFGICSRGGPRSTVDMYGWSKMIVRCPCTPTSILDTFGEKISASTGSSNKISGLLKEDTKFEIAC